MGGVGGEPVDRAADRDPLRREVGPGTKPWCSGAGACDHALVTARTDDGYRLFAADLEGATPVDGTWPSLALPGSDSRSVRFEHHPADAVGGPEEYLARPGFWHGAVGVAAVWVGGAAGVAGALATAHTRRPLHVHALAHVGAVDAALAAAGCLLQDAGRQADADPGDAAGRARLTAARVRAVAERTATEVVDRVGRALAPRLWRWTPTTRVASPTSCSTCGRATRNAISRSTARPSLRRETCRGDPDRAERGHRGGGVERVGRARPLAEARP